uniref:Uncharacterized protein n=1 Tax=Oryza meridionalis TaxID=40149 RepID=A0A0E0FCZ5_9ORYZ
MASSSSPGFSPPPVFSSPFPHLSSRSPPLPPSTILIPPPLPTSCAMAAAAAVRSVAISLFVVTLAVAAFAWSPSSLAGGASHHLRLEENGYLSFFAAMRRDSVPCTRKGASYYNCVPGAPPSPYNRSCEHITRCHG